MLEEKKLDDVTPFGGLGAESKDGELSIALRAGKFVATCALDTASTCPGDEEQGAGGPEDILLLRGKLFPPVGEPKEALFFAGIDDGRTRVARSVQILRRCSRKPIAALPKLLAQGELENVSYLVTTDHLSTAKAYSRNAWRARPLSDVNEALLTLAEGIKLMHDAGFSLNEGTHSALYISSKTDAIVLPQIFSVTPFEGRQHTERSGLIRQDLSLIGKLLVDKLARQPFAEVYPQIKHMLDDLEVLARRGMGMPGVPQVIVGTLTDEQPFVYQNAHTLIEGLLQLRAEMTVPFHVNAGLASTAGNFPRRRKDQDSVGISETKVVYHGEPRHVGLYIVADGVGGEEHGERASQTAIHGACTAFYAALGRHTFEELEQNVTPIARAIAKVAAEMLAIRGETEPDQNKGATTLTLAMVVGNRLGVAHLGDSRAYLHRNGAMIRLTRDHNLANVKVALGELTPQEAETRHDDQRRISRFAGTSNETPMSWIDGFDPALVGSLATHSFESPAQRRAREASVASNQTQEIEALPKNASLEDTADENARSFAPREPTSPQINLGLAEREARARTAHVNLAPGDKLVLMSDGLSGEMRETEMAAIIGANKDPNLACRMLIDSALDGFASDNVSVVIAHFSSGRANLDPER